MRIRLAVLLLAAALVFVSLAGCSHTISFTNPAEKRRESISDFISGNTPGDVAAEPGKTYATKWFEFTVHSIEKVDAYTGRTAEEGHQLYKVLLSVKSIWDAPIPMGLFDFYMDAPDFTEYIWAIPPLDGTMMPEEYNLTPNETVQYVMIFEVPTYTAGLALLYTENFEDGNDGATFAIPINE